MTYQNDVNKIKTLFMLLFFCVGTGKTFTSEYFKQILDELDKLGKVDK